MADKPRRACFVFDNVQPYSQNHKIALLSHAMGHQRQCGALSKSSNARKLCSRVSLEFFCTTKGWLRNATGTSL